MTEIIPTGLSDVALWSFIVSFGLPLLIAVLQRPTFTPAVRTIITVLTCLVAALITVTLTDQLTGRSYLSSALLVLVATVTFYEHVWKPTKVAPRLEAATSPNAETAEVVKTQTEAVTDMPPKPYPQDY